MLRAVRRLLTALVIGWLAAAEAHGATVVDFLAARWTKSAGGDGQLRALVVVAQPWSWHEAAALAADLGGSLAAARSPAELSFLEFMSDFPGAFDCAGPWLGGFRPAAGQWLWADGSLVQPFGWKPLRPAQSFVFDSALAMSGIDGPDGRWIDLLPEVDSGVSTRSALVVWTSFSDCDSDGIPDRLEIARTPGLDADGDGVLDTCPPPLPADVNGDGRVDAQDLTEVLNSWGTPGGRADIDGDGTVNAADLTAVLSSWTGA